MIGFRPHLYWKICWKYVSPALISVITVASIINLAINPMTYSAWDKDQVREKSQGITHINICWVYAAAVSEPLPHYSLFWSGLANYRPHLGHIWPNNVFTLKVPKKCAPILVTIKNAEKDDPVKVSRVLNMELHPVANPSIHY